MNLTKQQLESPFGLLMDALGLEDEFAESSYDITQQHMQQFASMRITDYARHIEAAHKHKFRIPKQ